MLRETVSSGLTLSYRGLKWSNYSVLLVGYGVAEGLTCDHPRIVSINSMDQLPCTVTCCGHVPENTTSLARGKYNKLSQSFCHDVFGSMLYLIIST